MNFPSCHDPRRSIPFFIPARCNNLGPVVQRSGASVRVNVGELSVFNLSNGHDASLYVGFLYYKLDFNVCFKEKSLKKIVRCLLEKRLKNPTLQVLVHGFTYNHIYWDSRSINGVDYSYARYMADQGYAVLAQDLLGTGQVERARWRLAQYR